MAQLPRIPAELPPSRIIAPVAGPTYENAVFFVENGLENWGGSLFVSAVFRFEAYHSAGVLYEIRSEKDYLYGYKSV